MHDHTLPLVVLPWETFLHLPLTVHGCFEEQGAAAYLAHDWIPGSVSGGRMAPKDAVSSARPAGSTWCGPSWEQTSLCGVRRFPTVSPLLAVSTWSSVINKPLLGSTLRTHRCVDAHPRVWHPLAEVAATFITSSVHLHSATGILLGRGWGPEEGGRRSFPFSLSSLCVWMCFYWCGSLFYPT